MGESRKSRRTKVAGAVANSAFRRLPGAVASEDGTPNADFISVPDEVQDHVFKCGIAVVAMGAPTVRVQVHFHVAGAGRGAAELHDRATKIRAAFATEKTRMKNSHGLAVQRSQLMAEEPLVLPDRLQQALGRNVVAFAQGADATVAQPPLRIETGRITGHLPLLLRRCSCNVKLSLPPGKIIERIEWRNGLLIWK
jgi:hypothetical protein